MAAWTRVRMAEGPHGGKVTHGLGDACHMDDVLHGRMVEGRHV